MSLVRVCLGLALLIVSCSVLPAAEPKAVLLIGQGPDGHPPKTHEYMAGQRILQHCLKAAPELKVTLVQADGDWLEGPELIHRADVVVLFVAEGAKWVQADSRRLDALVRLAQRGGGLVSLHWAMGSKEAGPIDAYLKLLGGCHGGPDRRFQVLTTDLRVADAGHPITRGVEDLQVRDEFYYRLKFVQPNDGLRPVLKADIDGQAETVAWSWERPEGGRSFGFSGLHFHANWRRQAYRRTVTQAVMWVAGLAIPQGGVSVDVPIGDLPGLSN